MSPSVFVRSHPITAILLIINLVVFAFTCWRAATVFVPETDVLIDMGAKYVWGLINGEYWRFVTPVFVHIGIVHFLLNNFGLYVIGPQLEKLFGRRWFLTIYLGAGICGNTCSAVSSLAVSAGASGALFGLLGAGYYLERIMRKKIEQHTGHKVQRGMFGMLVVINIIVGIIVPGIDNAAHLGGLVAGIAIAGARVYWLTNRRRSLIIIALLLSINFALMALSSSISYNVFRVGIHAISSF